MICPIEDVQSEANIGKNLTLHQVKNCDYDLRLATNF